MKNFLLAELGLLVGAFLVSAVLTFVVMKVSRAKGFVAVQREDRHHKGSIALGGGIGIFATIFGVLLAGLIVVKFFIQSGRMCGLSDEMLIYADGFGGKANELFVLLGAMAVLFVVGLVDDIKHLGPVFKLVVQFVVVFCAAFFGDIRVELFIESVFVTSLMSAVWIVVIVNAFNFLDNMDGLSCGIAVICSVILSVAAVRSGQVFVSGFGVLVIGALLGFLVFNFWPAKIFMGDAGSFVVGFCVAAMTLKTTYYHQANSGGIYAVFMPLIVMAVPLYDAASVVILRIKQGKSPFVGDTQHFSHRMRRRGLSDVQSVLTLYLATVCCSIGALFLYQVDVTGAVLIFLQTLMILGIIAILESTGKKVE